MIFDKHTSNETITTTHKKFHYLFTEFQQYGLFVLILKISKGIAIHFLFIMDYLIS